MDVLPLKIVSCVLAAALICFILALRGEQKKYAKLEEELEAERKKNVTPPVPPKPKRFGVTKLVLTNPKYPGYREEVMRTVTILAETETMYRVSTATGIGDLSAEVMWVPKERVELILDATTAQKADDDSKAESPDE